MQNATHRAAPIRRRLAVVLAAGLVFAGCRSADAPVTRWVAPWPAGRLELVPEREVALDVAPAAGPRQGRQVRALAARADGGLEALVDLPGAVEIVAWSAEAGAEVVGRSDVPREASGTLVFERLTSGAWLLLAGGPRPGTPTRAWLLAPDVPPRDLGSLSGTGAFDAAALDDGGFAVLFDDGTARGADRARRFRLVSHDAEGQPRWEVTGERDDERRLRTPAGVAGRPGGGVAVLDLTRETVQWFDGGGRFERAVDLRDSVGAAPDYLTGLAPGPTGGLLVSQIVPGHPVPRPDGDPRPATTRFEEPLVWLDADGRAVLRLAPRLPRGAPALALAARAVGTPDGRIATFEGGAVYELDADGRARTLFGEGATPERLDDPRAGVFAPDGGVLVLDGRSGAVHRFGPDGARGTSYVPAEGDFNEVDLVELEVRADGAPALRTSVTRSAWIEFAPGGARRARHDDGFPLADDRRGGEWRRREIGLEHASDSGVRALTRRSDGGRLRTAVHATTDARGALAVVDMAPVELEGCLCFLPVDPTALPDDGDSATFVALWDERGRPERSFRMERDLSGHRIERAGGWLLIAPEGRRGELLRIADGALFEFVALASASGGGRADPRVRLGLAPDGRSVRALELDARRITHHPLPAAEDAAPLAAAGPGPR